MKAHVAWLSVLLFVGAGPTSVAIAQPSVPTTVLRASDGAQGDAFGKRVAVSHGTLVVGAHGDDDGGVDAGSAYVFVRGPGNDRVEAQKLRPASLLAGDFFGWSVAIDGDVLVVGAPGDDRDASGVPGIGSANRGAAYVFRRRAGAWHHEATLQPADLATTDEFGTAVAISGDTILVSAIYQGIDRPGGGYRSNVGAVYAFRAAAAPNGSVTWPQEYKFRFPDAGVDARLGFSLAIVGDVAVFGAPASGWLSYARRNWWEPSADFQTVAVECASTVLPATGLEADFDLLADVAVEADGRSVTAVSNCGGGWLHGGLGRYKSNTSTVTTDGEVTAGPQLPNVSGSGTTALARASNGTYWSAEVATVAAGQASAGRAFERGTSDGPGSDARFTNVKALDIHEGTQSAYVIDGCAIRRVAADMTVTTIAGDVLACGPAKDDTGRAARFTAPNDLQVVADTIYVADTTTIRRVSLDTGAVETIAGVDGVATHADGVGNSARFRDARGLTFGDGVLTVADASTIRRVTLAGSVTTLAGDPSVTPGVGYDVIDGQGSAARVGATRLVHAGPGRVVFIQGYFVREVDDLGIVRTIAGAPSGSGSYSIAVTADRAAFGMPMARAPLSALPRAGNVTVHEHAYTRLPKIALLQSPVTDAGIGAALAFTADGALVVGAANGCVWTVPRTCVNHALGTPNASVVQPVRLLREVAGHWVDWLALPTTGAIAGSQYGATVASEGTFVFVGASEWDYRPQDPAPHGDIVGPGAVFVYDLANLDTDNDTLPDAFELANGLDPASATGADGAAGDPDADGISNADEYAAGSHATAPPEHTRYFAEGATSSFFSTEIALLNPGTFDADVLMRFQKSGGGSGSTRLRVPKGERRSVNVGAIEGMATAEFATLIESNQPIVADRLMRWPGDAPYGSHGEHALTAPSTTWYLAEGATHSGFDLFYLLQNPGAVDAEISIRYLRPSAAPLVKTYRVPAGARVNVWVNLEQFPDGSGNLALASTEVSAEITSTNAVPIVVERAMYLSRPGASPGPVFEAGHESAGVTSPAEHWFFAEGATGTFFDLFVLIANPGATTASVRARYLLESGETFEKVYSVPAGSRYTVWVDHETFDGIEGQPLADVGAVSTTLDVLNGPAVVAERAMWWPGPTFATWTEAHNSPGATTTGVAWGVAAGQLREDVPGRGNVTTYLLVANPGDVSARVGVMPVLGLGPVVWREVSQGYFRGVTTSYVDVAAHSRLTLDMSQLRWYFEWTGIEPVDGSFSLVVTSDVPVVVEWSIYEDAGGRFWAAGANALGTLLR